MLPSPFSFIWALQILIWYSNFLRNVDLGILVFSIGYFCKMSYVITEFVFFFIIDSKAKGPECKLLSVSNSSIMSLIIDDAIINPGLTQ